MKDTIKTEPIYTPKSVKKVFLNELSPVASKLKTKLIFVKGKYNMNPNGRPYYGRDRLYYDELLDEDSSTKLTVIVPERIRKIVPLDKLCVLRGVLFQKEKTEGVTVDLQLMVDDVRKVEKEKISEKEKNENEKRYEILRVKQDKERVNIEDILMGILRERGKPRIAVITGVNAITDKDVREEVGEYAKYYYLNNQKVNLSNEKEIIGTLKKLDKENFNVIALVRGGGSGLDIFNSIELSYTVVSMKTPVVSALGHAEDKLFLDEVVDEKYITPTAFGGKLREIAQKIERDRELKEENKKLRNEEEKLREEIERDRELKEENKKFRHEKEKLRKEIQAVNERSEKIMVVMIIIIVISFILAIFI